MYQMKCMDPLHASPTINLSDPNQTSKMLVSSKSKLFDILMVLDGTLSLDLFLIGGIRLAPVKTEKSQFSIQALLLNDCNLLSVLTDAIIMTNLFGGMEQFVYFW